MTEAEFKKGLFDTIQNGLNIIYRNKVSSLSPINGIVPASYMPDFNDPSKQDTYLNSRGAKSVADLIKKLSDTQHPNGKSLSRIHGQSFVKSVIDEIVPQVVPDVNWAVDALAGSTQDDWDVFIAVENVVVKQAIDLGLCKIHPPKLPQANLPSNFQSQHSWHLDHHFIEIQISAPNHQAAHLKAREWASTILAFIHTPHVSMVTSKGPELVPNFFCYNKTQSQWLPPEWKIPHRMIEFDSSSKFDQPRINALKSRLLKWQNVLQTNSDLSQALQQAAVLIQMCKSNTDESTKLLLLVGAMDTMLMDEFFPSRQEREFNRRVGILIPQLKTWGFKADLNFLYRIYKLRSEIVHNGDRHLLNHFDLHTLEAVAVVLLNMLTDSGVPIHADALKSLNIAAPPKKLTFSFGSWVRSLFSGRK
ncbi:MAG: hypothetical protein A4S09_17420 [Proteobacteria bacterium SG_bin7]|nr:MAG: hypothetical protein A4S09_17420 [Proteobacteria bacterium SG_bin7]